MCNSKKIDYFESEKFVEIRLQFLLNRATELVMTFSRGMQNFFGRMCFFSRFFLSGPLSQSN